MDPASAPPPWLLDPLAQDPHHLYHDPPDSPPPHPGMTKPLSDPASAADHDYDHDHDHDPALRARAADQSYHVPPSFVQKPVTRDSLAPAATDSDSDSDGEYGEYDEHDEHDEHDDDGFDDAYEGAADADKDTFTDPAQQAHPPQRARRRAAPLDRDDPAALRARLRAAERRLAHWRAAASALLNAAALSPDLTTGLYARTLRAALAGAVADLSGVRAVRHVHASMPAVGCEAPSVDLLRWRGLARSTWRVAWAPESWWVSVAADAARWRLPVVSARVRVSGLRVRGTLHTAFSPDLSAVRVAFARPPRLDMRVDTSVEWGVVPVPVQESIDALVRLHVAEFVERRLSGDGMVFVLRRREVARVSDSDVLEATHLARSAGSLQLASSTFL